MNQKDYLSSYLWMNVVSKALMVQGFCHKAMLSREQHLTLN